MLCYCSKCGRITQEVYGKEEQICDCCNNPIKYIPDEYLIGKRKCIFNDELRDKFIEELVKTSPEFDQYLFDHRDEILFQKREEFNAKMTHGRAVLEGRDKGNSFGVTCPYCKATNVRKVSMTSRAISTGLFGFASKKIGKQWHCSHCGSDF